MDYLEYIKNYNCSTLFLPNMIGISYQYRKDFRLLNCYLKDESEHVDYECFYCLFDPPDYIRFEEYLQSLSKSNFFVKVIDVNQYKIVHFAIPEKYKYDFEAFLEGKYSLFSEEFKATFPKIIKTSTIDPRTGFPIRTDVQSIPHMIINKDPSLKEYWETSLEVKLSEENEIWEKPNFEREKFNSNDSSTIIIKKVRRS
jgi:hypothetical protein